LAVRIRNHNQPQFTLSLSTEAWLLVLELAVQHGWNPMGTVVPEGWLEPVSLEESAGEDWLDDFSAINLPGDWHAHPPLSAYLPFSNGAQPAAPEVSGLVVLEDALNLADALDRAFMEYEPRRMQAAFFYFDSDEPAIQRRPSLGALGAVLNFCQQGAFTIEQHCRTV
jgi:hypothetical protein